jgi:hypothetical protein
VASGLYRSVCRAGGALTAAGISSAVAAAWPGTGALAGSMPGSR